MMKHYDVVAAVVVAGDKVLCVQKGKTKYSYTSYMYEFPGGKVEDGETHRQALQRELMEEMSYHVEVGELLTTVDHAYDDFSITLTAYLCTAKIPDSFVLKEHIGFKWLKPNELPTLDWAAADLGIVSALQGQTVPFYPKTTKTTSF